MSSTLLLAGAGVFSSVCAYAASRLAAKQGRNVLGWAALTFVLPAVLLLLMKAQEEHDKHSARQI